MGESLLDCAERETLEETGLKVKAVKVVAVTNDVFDAETKHYITVFVLCQRENANAEPQVCLPIHLFHRSSIVTFILGTYIRIYWATELTEGRFWNRRNARDGTG